MGDTNFRQMILDLAPGFLKEAEFERYLYSIGLSIDILQTKFLQGVLMRMPTLCDESALDFIGQDRLIPRGQSEPTANYRLTLQKSFEAWQTAGTPWAILRQTLRILLDMKPAARLVASRYSRVTIPPTLSNSKWDSFAAGADASGSQPTHQVVTPGNWNWDSVEFCHGTGNWSRFWFILESVGPNAWCNQRTGNWDDYAAIAVDDLDECVDIDASPALVDAIWNAILLWKPANAECVALIISFDATHFDPSQPAGGGINPDGTYGSWSTMSGSDQVQSRTEIADAVFGHRIQ
jgi:hypothetical protein